MTMQPQLKTVDERGRLVLGKSFANKVAQIEQVAEGEFRLIFVRPVPEREMWLYNNEKAKSLVFQGLAEARDATFSKNPPDLKADRRLVSEIDE
jgi:hypothetical protein